MKIESSKNGPSFVVWYGEEFESGNHLPRNPIGRLRTNEKLTFQKTWFPKVIQYTELKMDRLSGDKTNWSFSGAFLELLRNEYLSS